MLPDVEAQQQGDEDTWDDDVTQTQHGKVTGFKASLQQVLRKHHCRRRERITPSQPVTAHHTRRVETNTEMSFLI